MVAIALGIFILPILFRLLVNTDEKKGISFRVLFPTGLIYSVWFFISIFLIIINISLNIYLWIFTIYALSFFIYEFWRFLVNRKHIKFDKNVFIFIIFLVIFIIFSLFIFISFGDATAYMRFGVDSKVNNTFSIDSGMYRYNSFYYIATIFGLYEMQFFYSIFVQFVFAIFIFFPILEIIQIKFKKLDKTPILIMVISLISLIACSLYSAGANWLVGLAVPLFLLLALFKSNEEIKSIFWFDTFVFIISIFFVNFSLTALIAGSAFFVLLVFYRLFFKNGSLKEFFLFPSLILIGLISIVNHNNYYFKPIFLVFWLIIVFGAFLLFWYFKKENFEFEFRLKNKKIFIYLKNLKINNLNLAIALIAFYVLCLAAQITIFIIKKDSNVTTISAMNNGRQLLYLCLYEFFGLAFIYLAFYTKKSELLVFFVMVIILVILYIVGEKISSRIPSYIVDRVRYSFNAIALIFMIFMILDLCLAKIKFIPMLILPFAFSFSAVNDFNMLIDTYFSASVFKNKQMINKSNMNFLMENYSYIDNDKKVFSEIEYPFSPSGESYFYWYNREIDFSQDIKKSPFAYESRWNDIREQRYQEYINFVSHNLEQGSYFDAIILKNNSSLININITTHYEIQAVNSELTIWVRN